MARHRLPQLGRLDRDARQVADGHQAMRDGKDVMPVEDREQHPRQQGRDGKAEAVVPLPAPDRRTDQEEGEGEEHRMVAADGPVGVVSEPPRGVLESWETRMGSRPAWAAAWIELRPERFYSYTRA